jgi:hypothetical protein
MVAGRDDISLHEQDAIVFDAGQIKDGIHVL